MNKTLLILCVVLLTSCGPSQQEKKKVAAVTCSIIGETRNMDAAVRVEKMNEARDKIGGEPFLRGDDAIKEAFEWGLCQELVLNEIILFPEQMRTLIHGEELELTAKEFGLLLYFVSNQNRVISKTTLGEFMSSNYADYGFTDDVVYTHIKNLKKKLNSSNADDYIKNVYGVGYKFTVA